MKARRSRTKLIVILLALSSTLTFLTFCMAQDSDLAMQAAVETEILAEAQPILNVPLTISQPGSYYLTENLTHTNSNTNAIRVNADNVTIDLAGYSLIGPGFDSGPDNNGIYMNGRINVEIRNGTITNFGNNGIWEESSDGIGHKVIGVRVVSNGCVGVFLDSQNNLVKDCIVLDNSFGSNDVGGGIICSHASSITDNVVSNNSDYSGIVTDSGCIISGNNVSYNGFGIRVWYGCNVVDNIFSWDTDGIVIEGNGCFVKGNTVFESTLNGIKVEGAYNDIEENLVTYCHVGVYFSDSQNFHANNRALNNTTNYDGSVPTGSGNGGGNVTFGTLSSGSLSTELEMHMYKKQIIQESRL